MWEYFRVSLLFGNKKERSQKLKFVMKSRDLSRVNDIFLIQIYENAANLPSSFRYDASSNSTSILQTNMLERICGNY